MSTHDRRAAGLGSHSRVTGKLSDQAGTVDRSDGRRETVRSGETCVKPAALVQ